MVLGERHLGEADADGSQDEGVEPVAARELPEPLPLHVLKVLNAPANRLAREDDPKIIR